MKNIPEAKLNGDMRERFEGNMSYSFPYVNAEELIMAIKEFAVSAGSACSSESFDPSYVLKAIGMPDEQAFSTLRIGIGRYTSEQEVNEFLVALENSIAHIRSKNPQWKLRPQFSPSLTPQAA